jgi:hypothetical protein
MCFFVQPVWVSLDTENYHTIPARYQGTQSERVGGIPELQREGLVLGALIGGCALCLHAVVN